MVFAFVLAVMLVIFVLGPLARAHANRVGPGGDRAFPGNPPEVARLREEVDRLSAEVAKLTEEQAFMLRLLAPGEQPGGDPHPAALEPPPSPNAGRGEQRPDTEG